MSKPQYTNIHDAKTHLSKLIQRALDGEEVIIAKAGDPLVKLVPCKKPEKKYREGGQWRGKIWVAEDFDDPIPEIEELFYEGPIFPNEHSSESGQGEKHQL